MSEMPANDIRGLVESYNRPKERMRSSQETLARYNQALMSYRELCFAQGDVREQKIRIYHEIKILGWVLGKAEKNVIKDIGEHSDKTFYGVKL